MRSYGQFCALAKALDVIGDRWTLLIVRELLIRETARYTDIREGLPGIATNLLASRLAEMEEAGIIAREEAPPPIATTVYRLTPRGLELEKVMMAIGRWGMPLMKDAPKSDAFCAHWIALPARNNLRDHAPDEPPVVIELRAGDEPVTVTAKNGSVRVRTGAAENPDAVVSGTPRLVYAILKGEMDLTRARAAGIRFTGDEKALCRVQPHAIRRKSGGDDSTKNPGVDHE
jgi:DNA-binding HxlR family transcriptional regulator